MSIWSPSAATAIGAARSGLVIVWTGASVRSHATSRLRSGSGAQESSPTFAAGNRPRNNTVKPPGAGLHPTIVSRSRTAPGVRRISARSGDRLDLDRMQAVVLSMRPRHFDPALRERQQSRVLRVGGLGADGEINRPVTRQDRERFARLGAHFGAPLVVRPRDAHDGVSVRVDHL